MGLERRFYISILAQWGALLTSHSRSPGGRLLHSNLPEEMPEPATLTREISPPPRTRTKDHTVNSSPHLFHSRLGDLRDGSPTSPGLAAVEAGEAEVTDHLAYFSTHLAAKSRAEGGGPRISIEQFRGLYLRNRHLGGRHFVVHQHDHPIAGVHCKNLPHPRPSFLILVKWVCGFC